MSTQYGRLLGQGAKEGNDTALTCDPVSDNTRMGLLALDATELSPVGAVAHEAKLSSAVVTLIPHSGLLVFPTSLYSH